VKIQGDNYSADTFSNTSEEWMVEIDNQLKDEIFPEFGVYVTVGQRWCDHTTVGWSFNIAEGTSDEKIRESLHSFSNFVQAVNQAYSDFLLASQEVINNKKE